VHAERAPLLVFGDRLDHRPENVGIDLRPVEAADVQKIGTRDLAETRRVHAAGKKLTVYIGKSVGPSWNPDVRPIVALDVHGAKQLADHLMGVRRVPFAHLRDGVGEEVFAAENIGIFGKEAKDQPHQEVIHVVSAGDSAPVRVVFQKLHIKPIHSARGADVEGAFSHLFDGGDARQRKEKAEMIGEVGIGADDRRIVREQILGLKIHAVGSKDETRLRPSCSRAGSQRGEGLANHARGCGDDMDVVGLQDAAEVRLVRRARAKPLDRRFLIAEGSQEGERELRGIERLFSEGRYGFFDLDGVHQH